VDIGILGIDEYQDRALSDGHQRPTIIKGPLNLPAGTSWRTFDVAGRELKVNQLNTGVYFLRIEDQPIYKVIKVQ